MELHWILLGLAAVAAVFHAVGWIMGYQRGQSHGDEAYSILSNRFDVWNTRLGQALADKEAYEQANIRLKQEIRNLLDKE